MIAAVTAGPQAVVAVGDGAYGASGLASRGLARAPECAAALGGVAGLEVRALPRGRSRG